MNRILAATLIFALGSFSAAKTSYAQQGPGAQITFSPWTRFCITGTSTCFMHIFGKIQSGDTVASVLLFESERKKLLRVTLPLGMQVQPGTQMIVDQDPSVAAPYVLCPSDGCKADYFASPQLVERLKRGYQIAIQGVNGNGGTVSINLPLSGFAKAYNGPPSDGQKFILDADLRTSGRPDSQYQGNLIYTPWTKFCLTGKEPNAQPVCFTGMDARLESGTPTAAAVLIEPETGEKKLRITVPVGVLLQPGTQIKFDQSQTLNATYLICFKNGCMADYSATNEIINRLRTAKNLILEATTWTGRRISPTMPLGDFAKAFDGPPTDPTVFEAQQKKLEGELKRRAAAKGKPAPVPQAPPQQAIPVASNAFPLSIAPNINCDASIFGVNNNRPVIETRFSVKPNEMQLLADQGWVDKLLEHIRSKSREYCSQVPNAPTAYSVMGYPEGGAGYIFWAQLASGQTIWNIQSNFPRQQTVQREQTQRVAQSKQAVRAGFLSQFGAQQFARTQQITANPFLFKGQVVGVYGKFVKMISERDAIFNNDSMYGNIETVVSDVPATKFRGDEEVVLALRVLGMRTLKVQTGEITIPDLQYSGEYKCRETGCKEFYD